MPSQTPLYGLDGNLGPWVMQSGGRSIILSRFKRIERSARETLLSCFSGIPTIYIICIYRFGFKGQEIRNNQLFIISSLIISLAEIFLFRHSALNSLPFQGQATFLRVIRHLWQVKTALTFRKQELMWQLLTTVTKNLVIPHFYQYFHCFISKKLYNLYWRDLLCALYIQLVMKD